MARSSLMAKKITRGMTYQWKAKDLANAREYLYGVANIVIQCYNEQLLKCRGSRGIGVPEQKRDIVKTIKMFRLRVFWPPWLAPYHHGLGVVHLDSKGAPPGPKHGLAPPPFLGRGYECVSRLGELWLAFQGRSRNPRGATISKAF
jgi:hypothetical protein